MTSLPNGGGSNTDPEDPGNTDPLPEAPKNMTADEFIASYTDINNIVGYKWIGYNSSTGPGDGTPDSTQYYKVDSSITSPVTIDGVGTCNWISVMVNSDEGSTNTAVMFGIVELSDGNIYKAKMDLASDSVVLYSVVDNVPTDMTCKVSDICQYFGITYGIPQTASLEIWAAAHNEFGVSALTHEYTSDANYFTLTLTESGKTTPTIIYQYNLTTHVEFRKEITSGRTYNMYTKFYGNMESPGKFYFQYDVFD